MLAAYTRMFDTYLTEDVLAETIRAFRRMRPDADGGQVTRLRNGLLEAADHLVDDFPGAVEFPGYDRDDQHVHAATMASRAHKLITCDRGFLDLSEEVLDALEYEVFHPDDFFMLIESSSPEAVRAVTLDQVKYWSGRGTEAHLVESLRAAQCPQFANAVESHLAALSGGDAFAQYLATVPISGQSGA
jgi:hypothetical protein